MNKRIKTLLSWTEWLALPEEEKWKRLPPQCRRVLEFVRDHGSINPMQALNECGIMRLAARINDLEWMGYHFDREIVRAENRFGEPVRYAVYRRKVEE